MEQTVSTALIVAIIAVVVGALGLIGGVIGYVQGTAALRRATLTRQRAAAAEEAALQARTQAEQAARTAQSVLDRLTGLRSDGEVADLPTGPLVLPPRVAAAMPGAVVTAPTGPVPVSEPIPPASEPETPVGDPEPTFFTAAPAARPASLFARPSDGVERSEAAPAAVPFDGPPASTPVPIDAEPTSAPHNVEPTAVPPLTGSTPVRAATDPASSSASDSAPVTGPAAVVPRSEAIETASSETAGAGPVPFASLSGGPSTTSPSADGMDQGPRPEDEDEDEDAAAASTEETAGTDSTADLPAQRADEPAPDDEAAPSEEQPEAPGLLDSAPPVSQRSTTGQITAGTRGTAPMDWAEALRTGAIPLPARSRGTYAAPSKAKGQPVGPPRFEIRAVGRQRYEAVNVGGATAEQAALEGSGDDSHLVRPVEARPKPVGPGGSLAFSVLRVEGRDVSVRITWMLNGDEERTELPVP